MNTGSTTFEVDARDLAAEVEKRGIQPGDRVRVFSFNPEDPFLRACRRSRAKVEAAGLSDEDVDRLFSDSLREVREDMRRDAMPDRS